MQSMALALIGVALVVAGALAMRASMRWRRRAGERAARRRQRECRKAGTDDSHPTWGELVSGIDQQTWDWNTVLGDMDKYAWTSSGPGTTGRARHMAEPAATESYRLVLKPWYGTVEVEPTTGEFVYTPFPDAPDGVVDVFQIGVRASDTPADGRDEPASDSFEDLLSQLGGGWVEVRIEEGRAMVVTSSPVAEASV